MWDSLNYTVSKNKRDQNVFCNISYIVVFVRLLQNWYNRLRCCVQWNNEIGEFFPVLCGVRQGGVLSPYLLSVYVNDLIVQLR